MARTGGGRFIRRPGSASDGPTGPNDELVEQAYREIELSWSEPTARSSSMCGQTSSCTFWD